MSNYCMNCHLLDMFERKRVVPRKLKCVEYEGPDGTERMDVIDDTGTMIVCARQHPEDAEWYLEFGSFLWKLSADGRMRVAGSHPEGWQRVCDEYDGAQVMLRGDLIQVVIEREGRAILVASMCEGEWYLAIGKATWHLTAAGSRRIETSPPERVCYNCDGRMKSSDMGRHFGLYCPTCNEG